MLVARVSICGLMTRFPKARSVRAVDKLEDQLGIIALFDSLALISGTEKFYLCSLPPVLAPYVLSLPLLQCKIVVQVSEFLYDKPARNRRVVLSEAADPSVLLVDCHKGVALLHTEEVVVRFCRGYLVD